MGCLKGSGRGNPIFREPHGTLAVQPHRKVKWNLFDLALVLMMIIEDWVMYYVFSESRGGLGNLSILRLLRLLRLQLLPRRPSRQRVPPASRRRPRLHRPSRRRRSKSRRLSISRWV